MILNLNEKNNINEWYNILLKEYGLFKLEDISIYNFYIFSTVCYSITEHILKETKKDDEKTKTQSLNEFCEKTLTYIYDEKYNYNHLKHMNRIHNKEEVDWEDILSQDYIRIYKDLKSDTDKLISAYQIKNVLNTNIMNLYLNSNVSKYVVESSKESIYLLNETINSFKYNLDYDVKSENRFIPIRYFLKIKGGDNMSTKQAYCKECGQYCEVKNNGKSNCCNGAVGKKE